MIKLQTEFSSGEAGFSSNPRIYKQLTRNDHVALYERANKETGKVDCYEVFLIKIRPKGTDIFGAITQEDEELYPSTGVFGKSAFSCSTLARAKERFNKINQHLNEEQVVTVFKYPSNSFSVKDLAELNQVDYIMANINIKELIAKGAIKFMGSERRNIRGKPTNLYAKVS